MLPLELKEAVLVGLDTQNITTPVKPIFEQPSIFDGRFFQCLRYDPIADMPIPYKPI